MAPAHSAFRVLIALADLGEATAAHVAEHTGLAYSTVTPKLRAWETSGHAEKYRNDHQQTLWRLTDTGRATTAPPPGTSTPSADDSRQQPSHNGLDTGLDTGTATATPAPADTGPHTGSTDDTGPSPDDERSVAGASQMPTDDDRAAAPPTVDSVAANSAAPHDDGDHTNGDHTNGDRGADGAAAPGDRRPKGSLRGAIFDILEAHPGQGYKVSELCKLIDHANEGTDAKKASAGAVANAAHKLVENGQALLLADKPATFRLAAAGT
ncbi:MarR family transcriptional regulator [Actinoplanes sp. NPDC051633]|uniref:MarR family transcriptional regulator n=1 Tax=Actinoplanes sp. NPDC051633 TaxID=3155670 RepID=UPI0034150C92